MPYGSLRVLCASLCTGLAPVLRAITYFTYNNFCDLLLLTCWIPGVCHNGSHLMPSQLHVGLIQCMLFRTQSLEAIYVCDFDTVAR